MVWYGKNYVFGRVYYCLYVFFFFANDKGTIADDSLPSFFVDRSNLNASRNKTLKTT